MSNPWIEEARRYRAMDEAGRAAYWSRLTPEQQRALQDALAASPPKKGRSPLRGFGYGCIGVLALFALVPGLLKLPSMLRSDSSEDSRGDSDADEPSVSAPTLDQSSGADAADAEDTADAEDRSGPWCVVELTNATEWPVPYNYGWDTWAEGPLKAVRPDLAPGETRRHCVEFDAAEQSHLQFRIRVDLIGSGGARNTQTVEYRTKCAWIEEPGQLETVEVAAYRFELSDGYALDFKYAADGSEPPFDHLGGDVRDGPDFHAYELKMGGDPPPPGISIVTPGLVSLFPLVRRCEQLRTPELFGIPF